MNLTVIRQPGVLYGIFGQMLSEDGALSLCTLERAYSEWPAWVPKIAAGTYVCKKGTGPLDGGLWKLESGKVIDTYQIMDVPPFQGAPVTDCLFHPANFNSQLNGCTALGLSINIGMKMIQDSGVAFEKFMAFTEGQESITVTYR